MSGLGGRLREVVAYREVSTVYFICEDQIVVLTLLLPEFSKFA